MTTWFLSVCLQRIVLPGALIAGIILRQNGFSLVYLFFLLCAPLIPVPSPKTLAGSVGHYQRAILVLTCMNLFAAIAFQLVMAFAFPPYGNLVEPKCSLWERIFRHIGLVRLDGLEVIDKVRYISPEIIVLTTVSVVYHLCKKLHPSPVLNGDLLPLSQPHERDNSDNSHEAAVSQRRTAVFTILGKYICLLLLCLAGILRPSLLSGVYYLSFLGLATAWACNRNLGREFAWFSRFLMLVLNVHITALFLYQLQWVQEQLPPTSPIPRYLGLTALLVTDCENDPRVTRMSSLEWASFLNPFILIILYFALCFESDAILNVPVVILKETGITRQLSTRLSQKGKLLRNQTSRWRSATRKVRGFPGGPRKHLVNEALSESTPGVPVVDSEGRVIHLIRGRESVYRRTPPRRGVVQDARGSVTVTEMSEEESKAETPEGTGILEVIINAGLTIAQLLAQSSYIGTSIIMMAWSITYHSWLTFILLLWGSVMWLVPNQRRAMLRSSPFLVLYAILLLLAQYIYGMDLTDDELPQTVQDLNLKQIGLEKVTYLPCKPLLIKTSFTLMFWITLKQYIIEKQDERSQAITDIAAPLQLGVGAATGMGDETGKTNQFVQKIGKHVRSLLTKFWIWIVASILFTIGITGQRMTIFRIIYMALALIFILTFQVSWSLWRKIMYGFWLTVIIYSMLILVMTYTYQFDNFDTYWERYLHIDKDLQKDIGLERFDTTDLFVKLLTPTFFVIITVVQLYYFHKDFLAISDIKSRGTSSVRRAPNSLSDSVPVSQNTDADDEADSEIMRGGYAPFGRKKKNGTLREILKRLTWKIITNYILKKCLYVVELIWLFLELHMLKIVMFTIMVVAVNDVCALHLLFVLMTTVALMFGTNLQIVIIHAMSFFASFVLLAKMIYQIDYIDHSKFNVTCDGENKTYNTAEWIGFMKTDTDNTLPYLLRGYIGIILIVTFHAVVMTRQKYQRHLKGRSLARPLIMFPGITFVHADKNIKNCLKYLANYIFYRFGVELCLISVVILIATRMDIYACVYAIWVIIMITPRRTVLSTLWPILTLFIAISLPVQYFLVVGLPPFLCFNYPWAGDSHLWESLREWLYLPDEVTPPPSYKLICDFIVCLMVCRQGVVFSIEKKHIDGSYAGGTNRSIVREAEQDNFVNPTMDFISYTRSYLDVVKRIVLQMFLWITLAIVFLAGTNRVNIFSLGYLIGAFIFLWQGNDLYLRPVSVILKWWHYLISYNVSVIFLKTILQMGGCLFMDELTNNACWAVQLFGIACIKKFGPLPIRGSLDKDECEVYHGDVGLAWDGVCFAFLILQRRLFNSYYFLHVVDEAKAMTILASRGAELIEELSEKRIEEQQEAERKILEKIKNKMDRIKASQKKLQGPTYKEPDSHYVAIRSGDYYMFDDLDEDIVDEVVSSSQSSSTEDSDEAVDKQRQPLSHLLSQAMKSNIAQAADEALQQDEEVRIKGKDLRRASMPAPGSRQHWPRQRAISLPDSPQKLTQIKEGPEPQPGTSHESDRDRSSDTGSQKRNIRFDEDDKSGDQPPDEEKQPSRRTKAINFLKFIIAFIISIMVTVTIWLNKFSRDYRFVMKTLSIEKKQLKANKNFGYGVRRGSNQIWEPLPVAIAAKSKSSPQSEDQIEPKEDIIQTITDGGESPMSIHDFEGSDEIDSKSQPAIIRLLMAMWYAVFSHSELLCYFMIFLHQIRSPTILSLPLPLFVFLWGTLSVPRPSKTFWVTIIAYTEVVVLIKCVFQFDLIPWNSKIIPDNAPFSPPRIIGIERQPGMYAYYDLLLLLVVFFHRSMLKSLGLWKVSSYSTGPKSSPTSEMTDLETSFKTDEGSYRNSKALDKADTQSLSDSIAKESLLKEDDIEKKEEIPMRLKSKRFVWPFVKFFHTLMRRTGKVTDDVYAYMFFCDFFNILVVIGGFASFGSSQGDGGVSQYFEENKVPIPFLVMLILQFGLIIVDRTLYLRKFILGKIIFQLILVIGIHVWMFFVLPAVTQRSFNAASPPQMWYFVKCIYLLLSAYQIRVGYPTRILGNFLCKSYNYINMILFKMFMFVPFVFELRALMDWVWTDTSMTLSDWLKMEDIFAHIFQLKCQRRAENEYPQPRGEKKGNISKYFMGGGCLVLIIAVIWFPLVLFALGNTVGEANLPYEVTISVQISSFLPIFVYTVQNDSITSLSAGEWETLGDVYKKSRTAQTFLSNYEPEDVGVITLQEHSASIWTMSPPAIATLKDQLLSDSPLHVKFYWRMHRLTNNPAEQPPLAEDATEIWIQHGDPARTALLKVLNRTSDDPITFKNLMPKFIKVTSSGTAAPIDQLMTFDDDILNHYKLRDIKVNPSSAGEESWWWDMKEFCEDTLYSTYLQFLPKNNCDKIVIYTFNDKAFPKSLNIISGKGIIGLYTTFVIVIHSVIRGFFTGISFKIMFDDMPNVDRVLQLCLDIYLVRESGDLDLEEDLFAKLVFLYRSPETLIKWTRPPEEVAEDDQQPELD